MDERQRMVEFIEAMDKATSYTAGAKSYWAFMTNFGDKHDLELSDQLKSLYEKNLIIWSKDASLSERVEAAKSAELWARNHNAERVLAKPLTLGRILAYAGEFSEMYNAYLEEVVMKDDEDQIKNQQRLEQIQYATESIKMVFKRFIQWQKEIFEGEN